MVRVLYFYDPLLELFYTVLFNCSLDVYPMSY